MIEQIIHSIKNMKESLGMTEDFKKYLEIMMNEFTNDDEKIKFVISLVKKELDAVISHLETQAEEENWAKIDREKDVIEPKLINAETHPLNADIELEEKTIESLSFDFEDNYKLSCPPDKLMDREKNKRLIELNIQPELLFYLRTLTHPFKPKLSKEDQYYLNYLVHIEGYDQELINYLLTGLNDRFIFSEAVNVEESRISYIEDYLQLIDEFLNNEENKEKFIVKISEESFEVNFKRKKTMFLNQIGLKWFSDYMTLWGFLHIAIKPPKKSK